MVLFRRSSRLSSKLIKQHASRRTAWRSPRFEILEDRRLLTITVDTLVDENDGITVGDISLRDAISAASPGETIDFSVTGVIKLEHGELVISDAVTISGPGANDLEIDAQFNSRIFSIGPTSGDVAIAGLTLIDGQTSGNGGAIEHRSANSLTIADSVIRNNTVDGNGGGGGIWSLLGGLTIVNSTIAYNIADNGGGIFANGVTLENSTVNGNLAESYGGGIFNSGVMTLTNTTITHNRSNIGAGIYNAGAMTATNVTVFNNRAQHGASVAVNSQSDTTLYNTIIAGNGFVTYDDEGDHRIFISKDVEGAFNPASSNNLIGAIDGSTGLDGVGALWGTAASPLNAGFARFLSDNGGLTLTYALLPGSPAMDAGSNQHAMAAGLNVDQRGLDRFVDADGDGTAQVDIGAVEFEAWNLFNSLRITEIMHTPPLGSTYISEELEFVELKNLSPIITLDLTDVRFTDGIAFDFSDSAVTSLLPGEHVLVVKNLEAFASRYDTTGLLIAGEYDGRLRTKGERLELVGAINQDIHRFEFAGFSGTNGEGLSVIVGSLFNDFGRLLQSAGIVYGGTPGIDEADATDTAAIAGSLFHDEDQTGGLSGQEEGVPAVVVNLLDQDNNLVASTKTTWKGTFNFYNLPAGDYVLEFSPPGAMEFTQMGAGSNVDPATRRSAPFSLANGEFYFSFRAGLISPEMLATIDMGRFLLDYEGDGIGDLSSYLDATIRLLDVNGEVYAAQHTYNTYNPKGPFDVLTGRFVNLPAGIYQLQVVVSRDTEFALTLMDQGDDELLDSDIDPETGLSDPFELVSGQVENRLTAGYISLQNASNLNKFLRISELMVNPSPPLPGELQLDNEEFEFIELVNTSEDITLNLLGLRFIDGVSFDFTESPETELVPGQRIVVVRNIEAFSSRYNTDDILIAGQYSGKLNNGGERLELVAPINLYIRSMRYDRDDVPGTQGQGYSIVLPATGSSRDFERDRFTPSSTFLGTPGRPEDAPIDAAVVINEILANSDSTSDQQDAVELFNRSSEPVDIGGWLLMSNHGQVEIPVDTTLLAGQYYVVDLSEYEPVHDEQEGNGAEFFSDSKSYFSCTPSSSSYSAYRVYRVYQSSVEVEDSLLLAGVLPGREGSGLIDYVHIVPLAEPGVTVGRIPNGTGAMLPTSVATFDGPNGDALLGSIVISEIMYHPYSYENAAGDEITVGTEFLELYNSGSVSIDVSGWIVPAIELVIPGETVIPPGETLLLTKEQYNWIGALSNGGELVQLFRPGEPYETPAEGQTRVARPHFLVDQVTYSDDSPWPETADGDGASLVRLDPNTVGDLLSNWIASTPTPGTVANDTTADGDFSSDGHVGLADLAILQRNLGTTVSATRNDGDLTGDGAIGRSDIVKLLSLWGGSPGLTHGYDAIQPSSQAPPENGAAHDAAIQEMDETASQSIFRLDGATSRRVSQAVESLRPDIDTIESPPTRTTLRLLATRQQPTIAGEALDEVFQTE